MLLSAGSADVGRRLLVAARPFHVTLIVTLARLLVMRSSRRFSRKREIASNLHTFIKLCLAAI